MEESKQINVVEDDRDFRESMVEYLVLAGIDVTGVASALDLYRHIAQKHYHIVVLDIGLPDQNGLVLAEYVRKNTGMRIVMLTAQSSLDSKVNAYRSGADIYLVKPIDSTELTASLQSILGRLDESFSEKQATEKTEPVQGTAMLPSWKLVRSHWALCPPSGGVIKLTAKEFDLLERLAASPNMIVGRQDLLKALDYDNDELGNRALDALVHRLRRKHDGQKFRIPIKTAHGFGYFFSEPVVIE
jgi:DNA-binding response OmpR family regulator